MRRTLLTFAVILAVSGICLSQEADKPKVSILGDSYSTFEDWLDPATNAIWYYKADSRYGKRENDVKYVEETWWHQLIEMIGGKLEKNNSYSGATVCNTGYKDENGVPNDFSDRSFITRMFNLGDPDIILVFGATNDSWSDAPIGEYKWKKWSEEDLHSFRPAMAMLCYELSVLYPKAKILFILNTGLKDEINDSVHKVCKHFNVDCLDLHDIEKQAGHPSKSGMDAIAKQIQYRLTK